MRIQCGNLVRGSALLLLGALGLWGQTERARLYGTVKDTSDAVIPEVSVSATNTQTGVKTRSTSNETGAYVLPFLAPGTYDLAVQKDGFRPFSQTGITLNVSEAVRIDVVLEVGATSSTVEVKSQALMLENGSGTVGQLMPSRMLTEMPLAGRQTLDLIRSSGALTYMGLNSNNKPQFSLAGGRVLNQAYWLDGGNIQNTRVGVGQTQYDPPAEFLEEFRVLASGYAAEYGSTASGVIITTTKSGTNQFHGSAYEFFRNDKLDAPGPTAPKDANGDKIKAPLRYNLVGGTLGGPIIRNRAFFFAAYQRTQSSLGSTQILTVPTALQRQGDFSQTTNAAGALIPIYDPFSTQAISGATVRSPFAGNMIPSNRLDPVTMALVKYWPQPNKAAINRAGAQNFSGNVAQYNPWDDIVGRVDYAFTDANHFYFRYVYGTRGITNSSVYPDVVADPNSLWRARRPQYYLLFSDTHTFSPNFVADVRFSTANIVNDVTGAGYNSGVASQIGLTGVPTDSFPNLSIAGVQSIGMSRKGGNDPNSQRQVVASLTVVRGNHLLKLGGEVRTGKVNNLSTTAASGTYSFATTGSGLPGNAQTGVGFASFLLGWGNSFSIATPIALIHTTNYLAAFVQDDWKVTRNLTLNLGLRWETDTAMRDENNRMNGFDPSAINPVSGTPGVVRFAGVNGWPTSAYNTDLKNFGPRFGFAWSPLGSRKWVVRGGYGIYFEHPFDGDVTTVASLGFAPSSSVASPDNGITPAFVMKNGISVPTTTQTLDDAFGAVPVGKTATTAVTYFEPDRRTGYAQQFSFGVQRQLSGNALVEVSYMGSLSRHMPNSNITLNQVPPGRMGPGNAQSRRPFPQFSNVSILVPPMGVTNYHAGMVRFEKRMSSGLTVLTSYTWSRNIGNLAENAGFGDNQNYQDYYNRRADKGPSTIDVPHRFTWSSVYDLPFGKSRKWLQNGFAASAIGGWSVGVVTSVQSGGPFSVTMQTDTTNAFSAGALRANVIGDPNLSGGGTPTRWFNTGAFQAPAAYT
ncbi:MAG: carboxypeptidase regulatory-like domain-containing protein, partial [Acidobacteria bacterium]|nr:carboxypeptidase regulatory-like domain-containing protein [Acidobacteriota bacterium]